MMEIADAAAAIELICTHVCRRKPGLRLSPQACEKRRGMKSTRNWNLNSDPFWECVDCEGPVPKADAGALMVAPKPPPPPAPDRDLNLRTCKRCGRTSREVRFYAADKSRCAECHAAQKRDRSKKDKTMRADPVKQPAVCRDCGKSENEVKFYQSRRDRCAGCIMEKNRRRKAAESGGMVQEVHVERRSKEMVMEPEHIDVGVEDDPKEQTEGIFYHCMRCGAKYEPYRQGSVWAKATCKQCMSDAIRAGRSKRRDKVPMDASQAVTLQFHREPKLLEALATMAAMERRSVENQVFVVLERALFGAE